MWIDCTQELQDSIESTNSQDNTILSPQHDYKNRINNLLKWNNIENLQENKSLVTLDIYWINLEIFIDSMFIYYQESQSAINIKLTKNWQELWIMTLNHLSQKDLILRDIKRLKIGSITSFPKQSKEKLSVYDIEKDRENYFYYIISWINNKYNNIFFRQNLSINNHKLFYKEIYENENCAEFCLTMIYFLETLMRNIYKDNQKANPELIFDEVLNTISLNSWIILNWEIIKKSFSLIKRFWKYSNYFQNKLNLE